MKRKNSKAVDTRRYSRLVVDGVTQTHKMFYESVKVNASLDDARFTKPQPVASPVPAAVPPTSPAAAPSPKLGALPTPAATDTK